MKIAERIKLWLIIGREYTLHQSILPYIFACIIAAKNYHIHLMLCILGLVGVVLAHVSVNILDDYFDWKKGAVEEYKKLIEKGLKARTHKCFYLEEGLTTPKTILVVALSMDFIAILIGFYIATRVGCNTCHFYRPHWKYRFCVYAECPYEWQITESFIPALMRPT